MNTDIIFKVVQDKEYSTLIFDAIESGFGEFDRIVKEYTRFDESSELSKLNKSQETEFKVSDEFFYLVSYMLDISKKTNGNFDPTVIDFLETYGYDKNYDFSKLEHPELDDLVQKRVTERPSWKSIKLNKKNKTITLAKDQRLDLGGIGKGYAIDCAYNKLKGAGLNNFLINAGGDMRASGKNQNNEVWKVELLHENKEGKKESVGFVELNNEALACSGSWARRVKQFHHLINPKTGKPENNKKTVYIKAPDATMADVWATAIFVDHSPQVLENLPSDLEYYFL